MESRSGNYGIGTFDKKGSCGVPGAIDQRLKNALSIGIKGAGKGVVEKQGSSWALTNFAKHTTKFARGWEVTSDKGGWYTLLQPRGDQSIAHTPGGQGEVTSPEALLLSFLFRAAETPQIGPTHISLFAVLVGFFAQRRSEPVLIKRKQVMALAKISPATYHKCLQALIEGGFVVYYPCPDPKGTSQIYFIKDLPEKDPCNAGVQPGKQ